jgi:DMSO/TMAO reductase YedYZ molybdopterin-dependent catalytic subunit
MSFTRRDLFRTGTAALLAGRARSAEPAKHGLITLSPKPTDLEMPVSGFVDEITPVEHFFVRCHTYIPEVKLADWKLKIDGLVEKPLTLTLADLKKLPPMELVSVLECAGNGRSFYEPHLPGAQWRFGSVGNARWTGVRLRDVLQMAGLKPGATELLMDGADVPLGKMPDFQRTITVEKGMHPDTMLAWAMNGKPLTAQHGFPLRVVAPGWASDSWVKWLQHIEVLDHEFEGFWMKTAYRHPSHPVAPGSTVDPKDMIPVADLNVKSVIAHPVDWVRPGTVTVQGVAWSNASPVTKVDVSMDAGKTWQSAKLLGPGTKYGFRKWSYSWKAVEGQHSLISRATNEAGQTQPMQQEWNPSGYLWNVAQVRAVTVARVAPAPVAPVAASTDPQPDGYKNACLVCHDDHMMRQQRLIRAQWDREITKMTGWGADVKPEHRNGILDYLASHFKP